MDYSGLSRKPQLDVVEDSIFMVQGKGPTPIPAFPRLRGKGGRPLTPNISRLWGEGHCGTARGFAPSLARSVGEGWDGGELERGLPPCAIAIGALTGVAVSLLLIFKPQLMARVSRVSNRWISMRHANRWLDRSISIERWVYRHHRAAGLAIMLGASYSLVYFGILFDQARTLQRLSVMFPAKLLEGLLDALVLCALTGGAVALLAGLFIWVRPSLLRGIEEKSNQWVSSRRATKVLDVTHDQVERFVEGHAQRVGWLLLGSTFTYFLPCFACWYSGLNPDNPLGNSTHLPLCKRGIDNQRLGCRILTAKSNG